MQVNKQEKIRAVYETLFYNLIYEHNVYALGENINAPDVITVSGARAMHDKAEAMVRQAQKQAGNAETGFDGAGIPIACEAMRRVMMERTGSDPFEIKTDSEVPVRDQFMRSSAYTRAKNEAVALFNLEDDGSTLGEDGAYPISPYDSKFANRAGVMGMGSQMGVILGSDVASLTEAMDRPHGSKVHLYTNRRNMDGEFIRRVTGNVMTTEDDFSGMSRLRKYMTAREYEAVRDWVNRGVNADTMTPAQIQQRNRVMERSIRILEGLREDGRSYTIRQDRNPGQIKACIDGTRIEVRITEAVGNEHYIGRTYDGSTGAKYRYYTTARKDPRDPKSGFADFEPSPEDSLQLVRYALGQEVDRRDGKGHVGRAVVETINNGRSTINATYITSDRLSTIYGPYDLNRANGPVVMIARDAGSSSTTPMSNITEADEYLRSAVSAARESYANELNVDKLIEEWQAHHDEDGWEFDYSGDPSIATMQHSYMDVLNGNKKNMLRPGVDEDEFLDSLEMVGEYETDSVTQAGVSMSKLRSKLYSVDDMTPEELVRLHAKESVDANIGTYDKGPDGTRFNPVGVANYANSSGSFRNTDDIVQAMRILGMGAEDVRGNNYYCNTIRDRLVKFDITRSVPMDSKTSPFMQSMYETIRGSLEENGVAFDVPGAGIRIDDSGVVQWTGSVASTQGANRSRKLVSGEIGQIFEPDERGVVRTNFNGSENYAFVPGYEAYIIPQKPGETLGVCERTRLKGYEQSMRDAIRYQIRCDVAETPRMDGIGGVLGKPTTLNHTYRHLYDTRYDLDFEQQYAVAGMDPSITDAIIRTQAAKVRYGDAIREGSTIYSSYLSEMGRLDISDDNNSSAVVLTGGRNMAIMDEERDGGYFDTIATPSTTTSQGTVRYMPVGASVTADGRIIPAEDKHAKCALLAHPVTRFSEYDKYDRIWMMLSNMMQAKTVRSANVAQIDCSGWNMEDGMPVSREWAEANKDDVLVKGDKICDLHGNKGVTPLIVDRNMSEQEAREQGIYEIWALFKANPELDIVMSPYSGVSRHNGGTYREGAAHGPKDLTLADGTVVPGAMVQLNMIITDKSAEAKTHAYNEEDLAAGRGRKASAQLAWALNSKGAERMMHAFYGNNTAPLTNLREYLITCGMDMSETGEIHNGYEPHEGEVRNVITMPELKYKETKSGTKVDVRAMRTDFSELIGRQGGVMEIPFQLTYPNGEPMPPMNDSKTDVVYTAQEWTRKGYTRKDGVYVRPTTVHRHLDAGQRASNKGLTWGMPVMSSYLRSGQTFEDGTSSTHDYTRRYEAIFNNACLYRGEQERLESLSEAEQAEARARMAEYQNAAQASYNALAQEVISRQFTGKHNIFRDELMAHRLSNSATSVWTADPRLGIDEVAVGKAVAETLGVGDGDSMLIWRDPILRDAGASYMKVKIDDSLTGCAVNPVVGQPMDGDFDGDTVANINIPKFARGEAERLFSRRENLLDYGVAAEDGTMPLTLNTGSDVKVSQYYDPELADEFASIKADLNAAYSKDAPTPWDKMHKEVKQAFVDRLNAAYKRAFSKPCGQAVIRYDSPETHMQSMVDACLTTGAKGNWAKMRGYAKQAGIAIADSGVGEITDYSKVSLMERTGASFKDQQEVMYATAVKSFATGVGGGYSQRGIKALRNVCPTAVLEMTKPVTQSILDSKHSASEALTKYRLTQSSLRSLWRGVSMSQDDQHDWVIRRDDDGRPMQATKNEWISTALQMYTQGTSDNGLNVSINRKWLEQVADALSDDKGMMLSIDDPEFQQAKASPLDRMAYGGTFEDLCQMASANDGKGTFVFEGGNNELFMPRKMSLNRESLMAQTVSDDRNRHSGNTGCGGGGLPPAEYEKLPKKKSSFVKSDTVEGGKVRSQAAHDDIDVDAILANIQMDEDSPNF